MKFKLNQVDIYGDDATFAFQKLIDECSSCGGGTVIVNKGVYKVGTIFLKSNVTIKIKRGAMLLAQTEEKFYSNKTYYQLYRNEKHMDYCLFYAENCENISLEGDGIIDGQGEKFSSFRPMLFRYRNSRNIHIKDMKLKSPASWTNAFIGCSDIWIHNVEIHSRANGNGDGFDFDGCENVFVSDCKLSCSDDCICLQNSFEDRVCKNIVITNCIFSSHWAGLRIGLLSCGVIEQLTVSNCIFEDIDCSGIKIQSTEGSVIREMCFQNLIMKNVQRPIFITANRHRERVDFPVTINGSSQISDMMFSNIISNAVEKNRELYNQKLPSCIIIDSTKEDCIEKIVLNNIKMKVYGDAKWEERDVLKIPYHQDVRAEAFCYNGTLPAKGIFARNVVGLSISQFIVEEKKETEKDKIVEIGCSCVKIN